METYRTIAKHYEECFKKNGDNYRGIDWPNQNDADKRYQVMLEIIDWFDCKIRHRSFLQDKLENIEKYSILDIGCGLGHLYEFCQTSFYDIKYTGLDISEIFIRTCMKKYPDVDFICRDILKIEHAMSEKYDFVIMNGLFTEKLNLDYDEMWDFFTQMLKKAYEYCNKGMAFNVMSKDVDWERDDLFHVPLNQLSAWLTHALTRNFVIRYDYGLYEYTVYVLK